MSSNFSGVCIYVYKVHLTILWTFISFKILQMFVVFSVIKSICKDQNNLQILSLHPIFYLLLELEWNQEVSYIQKEEEGQNVCLP